MSPCCHACIVHDNKRVRLFRCSLLNSCKEQKEGDGGGDDPAIPSGGFLEPRGFQTPRGCHLPFTDMRIGGNLLVYFCTVTMFVNAPEEGNAVHGKDA